MIKEEKKYFYEHQYSRVKCINDDHKKKVIIPGHNMLPCIKKLGNWLRLLESISLIIPLAFMYLYSKNKKLIDENCWDNYPDPLYLFNTKTYPNKAVTPSRIISFSPFGTNWYDHIIMTIGYIVEVILVFWFYELILNTLEIHKTCRDYLDCLI